jgi:mono/diheme cytochrome c family protein
MVRYRLNLFLLVLIAGILTLAWSVGRDVTRPNYESMVEGQMARSPAYDSFAHNPNFADGLTLRTPPAGTIARGQMPLSYKATPEDAVRAGVDLPNPFTEKDRPRVKRGQTVFANFCQVCHGPLGWGDGPIIQGGFPVPPSLLTDRLLAMPEGQMFHVLTYGQGRMPSVAAQLSVDDRWCAILYVRQLQRFQAPSGKQVPITLHTVTTLFQQNCAACHGLDGTGNVIRKSLPNIPDFTNLAWQVAQTEMAIVNQIDYGSLPMMPAFRYKLTRDQIQGLAVYVRSFAGTRAGAAAPPVTAQVSPVTVYQTYCFACHDTTGKGNPEMRVAMPEIPNFTLDSWQASRTDKDLTHSILEGKGKFMLPMKDKLGHVNATEMVALIRAFRGGKQVIPLAAPKAYGPPPPETPITGPITIHSTPIAGGSPPLGAGMVGAGGAPRGIAPYATIAALITGTTEARKPEVSLPLVAPSGELAARIRIGSNLFQQYCIICHGPDGTGRIMRGSMPVIPDFTSPAWHKSKEDAGLLASILNGKGTLMPANSGRITEEQARDLVAFIRAFGPARPIGQGPVTDTQFEKSFRQLQQQWEALEKELQKLKTKPAP